MIGTKNHNNTPENIESFVIELQIQGHLLCFVVFYIFGRIRAISWKFLVSISNVGIDTDISSIARIVQPVGHVKRVTGHVRSREIARELELEGQPRILFVI